MSLIKRESKKMRSLEPFFHDHLFDSFWPGSRIFSSEGREMAAPRVDISETDSQYLITADLPGVSKDDIELSLEQGILTLQANIEKEDKEEKEGKLIRSERYSGHYLRRLDLGSNASAEGIIAKFDNGALKINVPKVEVKEPESIKIAVN